MSDRRTTAEHDHFTVRAVVVDRADDGTIEATISNWPAPTVGAADLLVEPLYLGICGSDIEQIHGRVPESVPITFPHTMGHEWSGTVVARGDDVTNFEVGDLVLGHGYLGGNQWFGFTQNGAMADRFAVPAAMCFPVPHSVDPLTAALIEPFACVRAGVVKIGGIRQAHTVHVYGLGTIGLCAVIQAVAEGARVIALDPSEKRRALAVKLGAAESLDPTDPTFEPGGIAGADVVVEATGSPAALAATLETAGDGAQVLFLGVSRAAHHPARLGLVQERDLTLTSSTGAPPWVWPETIALVADKEVDLRPLVTSLLPMNRVDEALTRAQNAATDVKVVLTPEVSNSDV
ncbi:MAG: zinc-dependent alcohol dehydrogenase [Rhodococcus sp. (in: high G+C Gram-positive bacteria)]